MSHYINAVKLPILSHLQFLVLCVLRDQRVRGKEIRTELKRSGAARTGPAFYQLMARMEDDGLVRGWYEQEVRHGQIIRERIYEITAAGRRAWASSRDFYLANIERFGDDPAPA